MISWASNLFLLAGAQTCQLFENDLMATCKRPKETKCNFLARIWSAEHFNFKRYSIESEVIWQKNDYQLNEKGEENI